MSEIFRGRKSLHSPGSPIEIFARIRLGNLRIFLLSLQLRYHISLNATLKIYSVQEGDEGSYQCVAENDDDAGHSTGYLWLGGGVSRLLKQRAI